MQCECVGSASTPPVNGQAYDVVSYDGMQCNAYKRSCSPQEEIDLGCGTNNVASCILLEYSPDYLEGPEHASNTADTTSTARREVVLDTCTCDGGRDNSDGNDPCGFVTNVVEDICTPEEIATHCGTPSLTVECVMDVYNNLSRSHNRCGCHEGAFSNPSWTSPESGNEVVGMTSPLLGCVFSERTCSSAERTLCGDMSLNEQEELAYGRWGCYVEYDSAPGQDTTHRMCR